MSMAVIKNIIFDLGNVLLDLDYGRVRRSFQRLFGAEWDFERGAADAGPHFDKYQRGHISEVEFFGKLKESAPGPVAVEQLKEAWNGMLSAINPVRLDMLKRLGGSYRLYLLSNTNHTHLRQFDQLLKEQLNISRQEFEGLFDRVYYSCEIGMRKPDPEVYAFVLEDACLKPEETLLIDDLQANIEGAEMAGMLSFLHDPVNEIASFLPAWLDRQRVEKC